MAPGCQPVVPGKSETYKQCSCEMAERRAEVGGGHISNDRQDNITCRSEGPLAKCAEQTVMAVRLPRWLFTHPLWRCLSMYCKQCLGQLPTPAAKAECGWSTTWGKAV